MRIGSRRPPLPPWGPDRLAAGPGAGVYTRLMADEDVPAGGPSGVANVLGRAVRLLRCFTADDDSLTARELIERTGLPRATVHRLAGDLVRLGLLSRTVSGRYAMGTLIWELGHLSHIHVRLREVAQVHLTRLYDACGENVLLAVMTTDVPETAEVMYVGHIRGPRSVPVVAHEGARFPLHATASGKALAATQSPAWLDRFLQRPFETETTLTLTDPARIGEEIARARSRGYAVQREEMTLGGGAVAAAIPSGDDLPPAAIAVAAAVDGWDERRLATLVKVTARAIAKDLRATQP